MSGKYTSVFDEMLSNNEKQMNDFMAVPARSSRSSMSSTSKSNQPSQQSVHSDLRPNTSSADDAGASVSGAANGIPFRLNV